MNEPLIERMKCDLCDYEHNLVICDMNVYCMNCIKKAFDVYLKQKVSVSEETVTKQ